MRGPGKHIELCAIEFQRVVALYLVLAFFSIPQLINDFLLNIRIEFGIPFYLSHFLAGIFIPISLGILFPIAQGRRRGVI